MYKGNAQELLKDIEVGDRIVLKKDKKSYEGILMPRTEQGDDEHIVLKFVNGYNIGFDVAGLEVKRVEKGVTIEIKSTPIDVVYDKEKPNITIIGTGGTIASKIDYKTGAVLEWEHKDVNRFRDMFNHALELWKLIKQYDPSFLDTRIM